MRGDYEPTFLNVRETAKRLGVHENTIRNWVREGRLRSSRLPGTKYHRFDERDVERLRTRRGQPVSPIGSQRLAISPALASASDLALWPDRAAREAQEMFPELIRRLLASTPGVTNSSVRAGDGIVLPGWDGSAESRSAPFLPDGALRFELGTNKRIRAKADKDWAHRNTAESDKRLTFVFATPRRWRDRETWAQDRREEQLFEDVRVLDADDLEAWLQATPEVHYWISEVLGHRPRDVETLEQWWTRFRQQTDPELPADLFLAGRDAARDELVRVATGNPDALAIQSRWTDDALAFIAATLDWVAADRGEIITPLVVKSAEVWERLIETSSTLVLIPRFDDPQIESAVRRGHHVLAPVGANETVLGSRLELDRPRRDLAQQSLEAVGIPFHRAYELSALARRSMRSLIRQLARDQRLRDPEWARPAAARILAPLVLLGSWSTTSQADLEVVEALVGESWLVIERALKGWLRHDDPPFIRTGDTQWHLASAEEAFPVLYPHLTSDDLKRWRSLVPQVLIEHDPVLDLEPEERHLAMINDIQRSCSRVLRAGIADGLVLVGTVGALSLGERSSGEEEARRVVGGILARAALDATGSTWQSLADVLPLLAEAAPYAFLDAVTDDLTRPDPLLGTMFQDGDRSSWLSSSSPHTGLLWALETLCWSPEYLPLATLALARLERIDPGGKLSNRPLASLQEVFPGWIRHTSASVDERVAAIDQICKRLPDVGWELLMNIWPSHHASVMAPHAPRHTDWTPDSRSVPISEWVAYVGKLVQLAIDMAAQDPGRWGSLAERVAPLPSDDRDRVIDALARFSDAYDFSDEERLGLWERLHAEVARHMQFKDAEWAMDESTVSRLVAIEERLEPDRGVERFAYLFDWRPDLPDFDPEDFAGHEARLEELRLDAVRRTIDTAGTEGLRALAARVKVSHFLGFALARVAPENLTPDLATWLDSKDQSLSRAAASWVQRMTDGDDGLAWFRWLLATRELEPRPRRLVLAWNMPAKARFWDALAEIDPELAEEYWKTVQLVRMPSQDLARGVDELLSRDRPWMAIDVMAGELHHPDRELLPLTPEQAQRALDAAARSTDEQAVSQTIGYEVGVVLDFLESSGADAAKLASYEFVFFRLIEHHRVPRALYQEIGNNPDTYVDLASRVYRANNEQDRPIAEQETALAQQAWWVLTRWKGLPGLDDNGVIDNQHFSSWVKRARLAFAEKDREDVGDELIGQVLSNSPPGTDGIWPAEPVREIIETTVNSNIESGLVIGRQNNRGPTTRGVFDGGAQERNLAAQYRDWSRATASNWPRTSRLLRLLAESYESDARREDARAEIDSDTH